MKNRFRCNYTDRRGKRIYTLNLILALKNFANIFPSIIRAIQNSYSNLSKLFINRKFILSREETTQRDPLAMAMYGLATLLLIK